MDDEDSSKLLIVQCDSRDSNQNLVKGAQYCMQDLVKSRSSQDYRPLDCSRYHVVFIVQLDVASTFTGFLVSDTCTFA
jgi:hypothetical protein